MRLYQVILNIITILSCIWLYRLKKSVYNDQHFYMSISQRSELQELTFIEHENLIKTLLVEFNMF